MSELAIQDLSVVVLAGGLGTRLRSVIPDVPKPMAAVNGRPFLEILVKQAADAGLRDIILCVGYRADAIKVHFGDGQSHGVNIRYAVEKELLGTAGAVLNAETKINSDPFMVMNGDSFCAADFSQMMRHHKEYRAIVTIAAVKVTDSARYGSLELEHDGAVAAFNEKSQSLGAGWINAGIYLLQKSVLRSLLAGRPASLERDVFPALVGQRALYAFKTSALFIDIGIPSELRRAQTLLQG